MKFKANASHVALVSPLHYSLLCLVFSRHQVSSGWVPVVLFLAGTRLRESITWGSQSSSIHTGVKMTKQRGWDKGADRLKKRGKKTDKQEQTKRPKKLQNSKNITQPSTAKVQFSILHYKTVTDCWQSGGQVGTQRAEDDEHPQRGAQYRVKSQGGSRCENQRVKNKRNRTAEKTDIHSDFVKKKRSVGEWVRRNIRMMDAEEGGHEGNLANLRTNK